MTGGYQGNGTFAFTYQWTQDAASGIPITASRMDQEFADATSGFNTVICRDGQSTITADIGWGGFRITGLAIATTTGDALSYGNDATIANLTVTGSAGNVSNGVYAPTATNIENTSGLSTSNANYLRVGNRVTVSGLIVMTITTGAGTATEVDFNPPIASTFVSIADAIGVCATDGTTQSGIIAAETTGAHRIRMVFSAQSTGAQSMYYHYTYVIR